MPESGFEAERQRRFQVHKQYLRAIGEFLTFHYGTANSRYKSPLDAQRDLPGYGRIQRRKSHAPEVVTRCLQISWASQIQLRFPRYVRNPYLTYTNAWAPVHAYYSVYMAMQAWFGAQGQASMVDDHTSSLRTISRDIVDRQLFPLPWSVACRGLPQLGDARYLGLPPDIDPTSPVEVLSNPSVADFWPRYCTLLATTRARRLERVLQEWKRRHSRKAMYSEEKRQAEDNVWATTLFDFLFRLRVRSNYRDVSSFVMSQVDDYWHDQFLRALIRVTDATTLLLYSLVIRTLGPDLYVRALEEFLGDEAPAGPARFLPDRMAQLIRG
jgi:hypothetical protein